MRRGHPLSGNGTVELGATAGFDWVLQPAGALLRRTLEQLFVRRNVDLPERVLYTSSLLLTLVMVARSDAIAASVGGSRAFHQPGTRRHQVLPLDVDIEVQPYSLITARNRTLTPAAQTLYDAILERMR